MARGPTRPRAAARYPHYCHSATITGRSILLVNPTVVHCSNLLSLPIMRSSITFAAVLTLAAELTASNAFSPTVINQHRLSVRPSLGRMVSKGNPSRALSGASSSKLYIFGNMFGGDDASTRGAKKGELASFGNLEKSANDADVAFDSISTYLVDWANLFEGDRGKERGLTTSVAVTKLDGPVPVDVGSDDDDDDDDDTAEDGMEVIASSGVKFTFKPPPNAFDDRNNNKDTNDGEKTVDEQKKKKKETSPGGVQVLAQKILSSGGDGGVEVRVVATRCDIDEGTIIKEMSEECICDDLRKAIKIWRDERK